MAKVWFLVLIYKTFKAFMEAMTCNLFEVTINTSGRKLLTICSSHSLENANGQTPGDRLGNFTCFNNRGAIVVNYLVLSRSLVKNVINIKVLPPNFESKHAPITTIFKISFIKFGKG